MTETQKTKFHECGFLSDEVEEEKWKIKKHYEKEFVALYELNTFLMDVCRDLHPSNSRKELISNIIAIRFCQSFQSSVILLNYAINADSYSIIRNMQECYLALACLLKDEDFFIKIGDYDETKFKKEMILFMERNAFFDTITKGLEKKFNKLKSDLDKTLNDFDIKSKTCASVFYDKTKDEPQSQSIYYDYKMISNTKCHISVNSFLNNFEIKDGNSYIKFRGINIDEMQSSVKRIIDVCTFFILRLDDAFLNKKYGEKVVPIAEALYKYYIKKDVLVSKDDFIKKTG
ncbi:DUF5677 domain-containing protein [Komagataeibacter xylinus]|uniref:Uncharacterized protein n=1 Tax=Komagataeibacter xylinus TaxID=28448 RepID=A0A857FLQ2_KOMXY|nr:DUF5677 domain-containing protein [Komagataeibacter xylinus]QHC35126.1 hypothetical protein FMA36_06050 [Komagataeibacter xylinus]